MPIIKRKQESLFRSSTRDTFQMLEGTMFKQICSSNKHNRNAHSSYSSGRRRDLWRCDYEDAGLRWVLLSTEGHLPTRSGRPFKGEEAVSLEKDRLPFANALGDKKVRHVVRQEWNSNKSSFFLGWGTDGFTNKDHMREYWNNISRNQTRSYDLHTSRCDETILKDAEGCFGRAI